MYLWTRKKKKKIYKLYTTNIDNTTYGRQNRSLETRKKIDLSQDRSPLIIIVFMRAVRRHCVSWTDAATFRLCAWMAACKWNTGIAAASGTRTSRVFSTRISGVSLYNCDCNWDSPRDPRDRLCSTIQEISKNLPKTHTF